VPSSVVLSFVFSLLLAHLLCPSLAAGCAPCLLDDL
jgi:hypothetical protein